MLTLDMTRPLADIEFSGVASSRVGTGFAEAAVAAALETGAALLASEQFGIAEWCFGTTLAYAKQRKQFGRAIGSYQAIKHRLADLWIDVNAAGSGSPVRRGHPREPGRRRDDRRGCCASLLQRCRCARRRRMCSAAWRHRDDVGISGASVPEAGQERSVGLRYRSIGTGRGWPTWSTCRFRERKTTHGQADSRRQPRGLGDRPGLYGYEPRLRAVRIHRRDDWRDPRSGRARRHLLRHCGR